jgi:hypothetical protein
VPLDEVKPGNKITAQLKKLMLDPAADKPMAAADKPKAEEKAAGPMRKFKLSPAK